MLHRLLGLVALLLLLFVPTIALAQVADRPQAAPSELTPLERAVRAHYSADVLARFQARFEQQRPVPPLLDRYFRQKAASTTRPEAARLIGDKHRRLQQTRSPNPAAIAAPLHTQQAAPARLASATAAPDAFQRFPFVDNVPAVFSLPGGTVLAVFETGGFVYGTRSPDAGQSWQEPVLIRDGEGILLDDLQSQTGRLLLVYLDFSDFSQKFLYSDDDGATWQTAPIDVPQPPNADLSLGRLTQTPDGTLWRTGTLFDFDTFEATPVYVTSTDDGLTWSAPVPIDVGPGPFMSIEQIVSFGGDLLALVTNYDSSPDIATEAYRSTDGGQTWTGPDSVLDGEAPNFVQDAAGTWGAFLVVYEENPLVPFTNIDIAYQQSTDGGLTWGPLTRLTRFIGRDSDPHAVLVDGTPLVFFESERDGRGVFYGTPASIDPAPPVLGFSEVGLPKAETAFRAVAWDETGVAEVTVAYSTGAGSEATALNDSGLGADRDAGDNVWSGRLGPVAWGSCLVIEAVTATDTDGNTASGFVDFTAAVLPVHDVGASILGLFPDGRMGAFLQEESCSTPFFSPSDLQKGLTWPKGDDYEFGDFFEILNRAHLANGGPWIAATTGADPSPRVINTTSFFGPSEWTATAPPVVVNGTGAADQDITVTYDDQAAPRGPAQESPPLGVAVTQKSYQWSGANRDDFIMIAYDVHNTGAEGDLADVAAGLFLDTDIVIGGDGPLNNIGSYDAASGLLYSTSTLPNLFGEPTASVGLKVLGSAPQATTFFYNTFFLPPGSSLPGDPEDEATVYSYLVDGALTEATEPGDLRMVATAPLFDLPAGASETVYFGIVMGQDLDELRTNSAVMDLLHAVRFKEAPEGASALAAYVAALGLEAGLTNALTVKLRHAAASYARGNDKAGDNQVGAFVKQVQAKRGKDLVDEEADYLLFLAGLLQANDAPVTAGKYDGLGNVAEARAAEEEPTAFALAPNYPNPFNPATMVTVAVPTASQVRVAVYNVLGQQVRVLIDGSVAAGTHQVRFDGQGLSSGVYLLRMDTPQGAHVRQMLLMK